MHFIDRIQKLKSQFSYDREISLEDSPLDIRHFLFVQEIGENEIVRNQQGIPPTEFCSLLDNNIVENSRFTYPVFIPKGVIKTDRAILLLHGLNEHTWEKYLPWAERLAYRTGRAVILFPIAFHMNRTPSNWYNPRAILPYVHIRKQKFIEMNNTTFVNVAISSRISDNPGRFYISGRESFFNLWQLIKEIKNGQHPLFKENTSVNLFAYSIGAFLSQVLFLANPEQLVSDSKLFMFCGGSIFSRMDGNARDIMDKESFQKLRKYLLIDFLRKDRAVLGLPPAENEDFMEKAFKSMLSVSQHRGFRESFFIKAKDRIRAVTLKKDTVIPTLGVKEALGENCAGSMVKELDFPYEYNHQVPFPVHNRVSPETVHQCFAALFDEAADFIG
ncbi:MAG: DUF6051 family protein [Dysgonamonadaceae bacterium]|jgi:pimeloyl-ACP methyl ester carboxylesterase|nr:DUF6051 family protein [Dysgonamonadaceae bacterium]